MSHRYGVERPGGSIGRREGGRPRNLGASTILAAAILVTGILPSAAACGGGDAFGPSTDPDRLRAVAGWELREIRGPDRTVEPVQGPRGVPTLRFTGGDGDGRRLEGDGGCNLVGALYDADDDGSLELRQLVGTDMACFEPGVMEVEAVFLDALSAVRAFRVESSRLILEFDGGEMVLVAAVLE